MSMTETVNTGVIYKITNNVNGKIYIGKAFSYEKHGKQPPSKYGAEGRFRRHLSNAFSENTETANECPEFYADIRKYGKEAFTVETLRVYSKIHLKENERKYIVALESYKEEKGYNIFVGDSKPIDESRARKYTESKQKSNASRAQDGSMKKAEHNVGLPANINYRIKKDPKTGRVLSEGYFVQIKLDGKLYNKAFLKSGFTMEQKLESAKEYLSTIKEEHQKNQSKENSKDSSSQVMGNPEPSSSINSIIDNNSVIDI